MVCILHNNKMFYCYKQCVYFYTKSVYTIFFNIHVHTESYEDFAPDGEGCKPDSDVG